MQDDVKRKMINFDLSQDEIKKHYKSRGSAYSAVRRVFEKTGFQHLQLSCYESKEPMNDYQILKFTQQLYEKLPWFEAATNHLHVSNIEEAYDLKEAFDKFRKESSTTKENAVTKATSLLNSIRKKGEENQNVQNREMEKDLTNLDRKRRDMER